MKLRIDNLDGRGLRDYTAAVDGQRPPQIQRRLNQPAELQVSLVSDGPDFVVPVPGARVLLGRLERERCIYGIREQRSAIRVPGVG